MLKVFIILWVCILMGCGSSEAGSSGALSLNFHGTMLKVPSKYVLPNLPASITGDGGSLDDGEGVSLKIPLPDIGYPVVSDKGLIGSIVVLLTPLPQGVPETQVSEDVQNAWNGLGLYSNRIVERDLSVSLYRVYSKAGHPKLWNYFKTEPDGSALDPKKWVANCMVGPLDQEASDLSNVKCKTFTTYKGVQVEFTYSGVHLSDLDNLLAKLKAQLSVWDESQLI